MERFQNWSFPQVKEDYLFELRKYMKIHSRTFKCNNCEKTFDEVWKLNANSSSHSSCEFCGKVFRQEEIKQRHVQISHENLKFYCHYFNNSVDCPFDEEFLHEDSPNWICMWATKVYGLWKQGFRSPPPGFGTLAIGREHSGTIDRGFSLAESVQLPLAAKCCHCFSSRTASDASTPWLRRCLKKRKNVKKWKKNKLIEIACNG